MTAGEEGDQQLLDDFLLSDNALTDFAGDAALLVDRGDRTALRDALARVLRDDALRRDMRARGPSRAAQFRWDRSARAMSELLRAAAARA
jgi:glycosyltransferase involved in cell wall biosynthesis